MDYKILGKTGLKISRLGFGGIPIQKIDAAGTKELMHHLLDAGINYIDTARAYTVSEEYLGEALEGIRQHFILATKSMARTKDAMAADIDLSLHKLRTDYIDLYQVHNPSPADLDTVLAPGGALEALFEAKAAGKIGHIGITLHSAALFERALKMDWIETIMFPYNIVETQGEEMIRACAAQDISFIAMKPLAGGAIEDAELALRFIAANDAVSVVIPGMAEPREIAQNLRAVADARPLTAEEQAKMAEIRQTLGTHFCRRCNYCAPCAAGIPISLVFLLEGYLSRYGLEDWARNRYSGIAQKASACIGCGICETRCPYELPIREMMRSAAQKFGS